MKVDQKILDAIEAEAAKHGGVYSSRLSLDEHTAIREGRPVILLGGAPCCPWGMAMVAGAIDVHPYETGEVYAHGDRTFASLGDDLPLPDVDRFDDCIGAVANSMGVCANPSIRNLGNTPITRVPWPAVLELMRERGYIA